MVAQELIKVEGLREFQKAVKAVDAGLGKALRKALNTAVQIVVDEAEPRIPRRSGRAARSLKASSTQNKARVSAGGVKAPHFPWLDFGGKRRGRGGGVAVRPFLKEGRYVWAAFAVKRDEVQTVMAQELTAVAEQAGLKVTEQ